MRLNIIMPDQIPAGGSETASVQPKKTKLKSRLAPLKRKKFWVLTAVGLGVAVGAVAVILFWPKLVNAPKHTGGLVMPDGTVAPGPHEPKLSAETIVEGMSHIWDIAFIDKDIALFDERGGKLHGVNVSTKEKWDITTFNNIKVEGEGGLLGLALDLDFANNKTVFACYNAAGKIPSVHVMRFVLSDDYKTISGQRDIITDIESQGGRHSGCRLAIDPDNNLWIGTGDSALPTAAQNPKSLAGKVLHVDREGKAVDGNLGAPFDARIYSYGHRNIQGIVMFAKPFSNGAVGLTVEHGPDKEDEINWIKPGNFGWNPVGSGKEYNEDVPMTNLKTYTDAVPAIWNSGSTTMATSGVSFLTGSAWSQWRGWTAVATLKGQHVELLNIKGNGAVKETKAILKDFGRIRTVSEGKDGNLYLATDNGDNDKIIRVIPK